VRELVDERQLRRPCEQGREIHVLQRGPAVVDAPARHGVEPVEEPSRVRAPVRLDEADDDVATEVGLGVALLQHPERLAGARGHAEEDLVTARHGG
jgi:hypothetical protein